MLATDFLSDLPAEGFESGARCRTGIGRYGSRAGSWFHSTWVDAKVALKTKATVGHR